MIIKRFNIIIKNNKTKSINILLVKNYYLNTIINIISKII